MSADKGDTGVSGKTAVRLDLETVEAIKQVVNAAFEARPVLPPRLDDLASVDAETVEAIIRVVNATLDGRAKQSPQSNQFVRGFQFLSKHWPVVMFLVLTFGFVIAVFTTGLSPLYPFEELAFKQRELEYKNIEFIAKEAEFEQQARKRAFVLDAAQRQLALAKSFLDVEQYAEAEQAYAVAGKLDPLTRLRRFDLKSSASL